MFNPDEKLVQKGDGIAAQTRFYLDFPENQHLLFFHHHFDQPREPVQEMQRYWNSQGEYSVVIQKQISNKQPYPYVSECSKDGTESDNLLTYPYTKRNCQDSCLIRRMHRKCGDVLDYLTQYLTPEMKMMKINRNEAEIRKCLHEIWKEYLEWNLPQKGCNCPYPCDEITFKQEPVRVEKSKNWVFYMRYRERSILTLSEVPLYTLSSILSSLGGNMGLMAGLSVLSVAEILIYCIMTIMRAIREH